VPSVTKANDILTAKASRDMTKYKNLNVSIHTILANKYIAHL
jgi:hypothetical protein